MCVCGGGGMIRPWQLVTLEHGLAHCEEGFHSCLGVLWDYPVDINDSET